MDAGALHAVTSGMNRFLAAVVSCLLAVSVLAGPQTVPTITSISPHLGTVTGGDTVTINLSDTLLSCPNCSPLQYEAVVTFDGTPARSLTFPSGTTIYAVTPAHASGTATIAVTSQGHPYGTATFSYAALGGAIERTNYERVLVPLSLPDGGVPGSFGSQWSSEFWAGNPTPYPVEFFSDISCTLACIDPAHQDQGWPQLDANSVIKLAPLNVIASDYGFLFYVQKTYTKDVTFSLHVADLSRASSNAFTEIGVVRESAFHGSSFDILNVPLDGFSRATLRVYDVNANDNVSVDATLYSMIDGSKLTGPIKIQITVPRKHNTPRAIAFPPFAGFGQLGDIRARLGGSPPSPIRIHVESHDGANQLWGFVAGTNNTTQLITTYQPE